ncbi:hypothetical protein K493DRAFT_297041 [Basidiobolus meristosporus CBS 931.73]|uniref:UBA domain-containing protein n=1 Tax=Basidiobolus meristosporus CBS 931.73 TaxID=1314790 RepID=A0A1Y1Z2B7_9FUNG|nr:hypothetical protein K493DRAFT_297041 [Basidiobolus meristosporus CBS 931.73]|eukprot:ORY04336.1 hypothetical protein K493DRAFT_297041 [Basidiobolus meristosporus CBS 931.73]
MDAHLEGLTKAESEATSEALTLSYEEFTSNFAKQHEEDSFPKAYQALVLSPFSTVYSYLLELEKKYAKKMRDIHKQMERNLTEIQDRHAIRMERAVERGNYEQDFTNLVSRHVEEMEVAQATWGSTLEETKASQRQEFTNFVRILYSKHQEKLAEYENHQLRAEDHVDKSILDATFLEFTERYPHPTQELASLMPTAETTNAPPPEDPALDRTIAELQEMGFSRDQAACALEITNRNTVRSTVKLLLLTIDLTLAASTQQEQAVMLLLENPQAIEVKLHEKKLIQSRKQEHDSSYRGADPSRKKLFGRVNSNESFSKQTKSWSPMSFLNQRQAQLSSNSNPSMRKLGGWLGKAMENLKFDENDSELAALHTGRNTSRESPQTKVANLPGSIQTLRLANRAHNISAFFRKCRQTTEFHFEDVEGQMKTIEEDFQEPNLPQPGDFFITRHSNLPMIHLLPEAKDINLTQRSPLITGLRNVLKTCQRYDVNTLQLPMLLLTENLELGLFPENLVIKRAELILKCMKGFMLENLRFVRPETQEGCSFYFTLPKYIQPRQFDSFKTLLGSVFKKS